MRTIAQVETELRLARRIATADPGKLGPSRDNDGRIVAEPEERRATAQRQVARLEEELTNLRRVVDRPAPWGGIQPYEEADEAAARKAIEMSIGPISLLREVAGAIAGARRAALLDAAEGWDANTNHVCDAPAYLRELAQS